MTPITVAVIYNSYFERTNQSDLIAEEDVFTSVTFVMDALSRLGCVSFPIEIGKDVSLFTTTLQKRNVDVVFNLAEGASHISEMQIASFFERMQIPFTGSDSRSLGIALDKFKSKQLLKAGRICVPNAIVYPSVDSIKEDGDYPQIVKPLSEDASIGIDSESVVYDRQQLLHRIKYVIETYHQPALVEEFIDGREFNISVYRSNDQLMVLPVAELVYADDVSPKICGFKAKWVMDSKEYRGTVVDNSPKVSALLKSQLECVAKDSFNALALRDYARVDVRIDDNRTIYVLEVNPNPCISPDSGFVKALKAAKIDFDDFINDMLQNALKRKNK